MKTLLLGLTALLFAGAGGGKVEWSRDVQKSLDAARKSGSPVMLFFTADW